METNRSIKDPSIAFGEFLWFIGIWMLTTVNPGMKRMNCFIETIILYRQDGILKYFLNPQVFVHSHEISVQYSIISTKNRNVPIVKLY